MPARQQGNRWTTLPDGTKVRNPGGESGPPEDSDQASLETLAAEGTPTDGNGEYRRPRTQAEANKQARERGIEFPNSVKTVKAKADFLAKPAWGPAK